MFSSLLSRAAWACPFCDYGGQDTALFILSIFGTLAVGAGLMFYVFVKKGGLKDQSETAMKVLEVEGDE